MVSFRVVSEIAMVPDNECRTPTLMGSAQSCAAAIVVVARSAAAIDALNVFLLVIGLMFPVSSLRPDLRKCPEVCGDRNSDDVTALLGFLTGYPLCGVGCPLWTHNG